jgi:hypothetical protein
MNMAALLRIGDIYFDAAAGEVFTSDGTVRLEPRSRAGAARKQTARARHP